MKNRGFRAVKWLLAAYLFVTVALPLFLLIGNIRISDVGAVLSSVQFLPMLKNSVLTTLISTVISVGLSFLLDASLFISLCKQHTDLFLWGLLLFFFRFQDRKF